MISDEAVRLLFQKQLDTPDIVTGLMKIAGNNPEFHLDKRFRLQIFRGVSAYRWKDAHPAGCLRHKTVFNTFGAIPKYCFDCYKVLVSPRTVVELFKLLMVFEKMALPNDNTRKCMTERRENSSGAYKGFVYCQGIEEANEVFKIVREAVSEDISPEVPVALTHGCSEFAQLHPKYARVGAGNDSMKYREDWQFYEDFVDTNFVINKPDASEADAVGGKTTYPMWEIFSMQYWLGYAATIGDASYLMIAGKTLPPIPQLKRPPFKSEKKR